MKNILILIILLFSVNAIAIVQDGQPGNANVFNNAFMSRLANTDTVGLIDLLNDNHPHIINLQEKVNLSLFEKFSTQTVSEGGTVNSSVNHKHQYRPIVSSSGNANISNTPFGASGGWPDGTIIILQSTSNTETVTVSHQDIDNGALLNGPATLSFGESIGLRWSDSKSRWIEEFRSQNFSENRTISTDNLKANTGSTIEFLDDVILDTLNPTTIPFLNASKQLESSAVTPTELGHLEGVTSAIQTQLDDKASLSEDNDFLSTGGIKVPRGTEAQRPADEAGWFRFNTDTGEFEGYTDEWGAIGGGGGIEIWEPSTDYEIGRQIYVEYQDELRIFVANTTHTSDDTDFSEDIANWTLLADASVTIIDGEINVEADLNVDGDIITTGVVDTTQVIASGQFSNLRLRGSSDGGEIRLLGDDGFGGGGNVRIKTGDKFGADTPRITLEDHLDNIYLEVSPPDDTVTLLENIEVTENRIESLTGNLELAGDEKVLIDRDNTLFEVGSRNPERKNQINSPFFLESIDEISTNDATVTQDLTIQPWGSGFKCTTTADDGYCEISKDSSTWGNLPVYMACQFTSNDNWTIQSIRDGNVINELELLPDSNFVKIETALAGAGGATSRYRFTSSDSGAELFGSACEMVPGEGLKTFDSVFRKSAIVDISSDANFSAGEIRVVREGNVVSVSNDTSLDDLAFAGGASSSVTSDGAVLPLWGRSSGIIQDAYRATGTGSNLRTIVVFGDGRLQFLLGGDRSSSGIFTTSYPVSDQYSAGASFATQTVQSFKPRINVLSSDVTTTGVMSDLTFDDLEVGAWYEVDFQGSVESVSTRLRATINIDNGNDRVGRWRQDFSEMDLGDTILTESNSYKFQATSNVLTFEAQTLVDTNVRGTSGASDRNNTFVQLTKLPNSYKLISELQDTLKYDGSGPMIGGYVSFGGASDGSDCTGSPCTRHREISELAENMSVVRNSEGNYTATISGFKPESPVSCSVPSANSGANTRNAALNSSSMLADATGEVEFTFITTAPNGTIDDTFFQIHCWGPRP